MLVIRLVQLILDKRPKIDQDVERSVITLDRIVRCPHNLHILRHGDYLLDSGIFPGFIRVLHDVFPVANELEQKRHHDVELTQLFFAELVKPGRFSFLNAESDAEAVSNQTVEVQCHHGFVMRIEADVHDLLADGKDDRSGILIGESVIHFLLVRLEVIPLVYEGNAITDLLEDILECFEKCRVIAMAALMKEHSQY